MHLSVFCFFFFSSGPFFLKCIYPIVFVRVDIVKSITVTGVFSTRFSQSTAHIHHDSAYASYELCTGCGPQPLRPREFLRVRVNNVPHCNWPLTTPVSSCAERLRTQSVTVYPDTVACSGILYLWIGGGGVSEQYRSIFVPESKSKRLSFLSFLVDTVGSIHFNTSQTHRGG